MRKVHPKASRLLMVFFCALPTPMILQAQENDRAEISGSVQWLEAVEVVASNNQPTLQSATTQPSGTTRSTAILDLEMLERQVPDIDIERGYIDQKLTAQLSRAERKWHESVRDRISRIARPVRVSLTLEEARTRALLNSFTIRSESFNPAIEATRQVEAEAAFDTVFFSNVVKDKKDRPSTTPQLSGTLSDDLTIAGGLRKLTPVGTQMSAGYNIARSSSNSSFQQLNPAWFSQFQVELRQPFLRDFGLDFNRSTIHIAKFNKQISDSAFERQVRDTLIDVEQAYWQLVQARREVVISARLLAELEQVYDHLDARKEFDVVPIQLLDTEARLETTKANFVRVISNVRDAEDRLLALINDPSLNLADEVEILPAETLTLLPLQIDRLAEVQTALDERPELHEAKLRVESAKLVVGRSKNQALPRADVVFRYSVDGLGESADDSFDEVTRNNFHEYYVAFEFEVPVGNRGPRAALTRSTLEYRKSLVDLKQVTEQVILDVNLRARALQTNFNQIQPNYAAVVAADKQVASIVARAERKDFTQLNTELNARQSLAASRRDLLSSVVDYNLAIMELERSKGTLLRYHNVFITEPESLPVAEQSSDTANSAASTVPR